MSTNGFFFDEAYRLDPEVTPYDVARSVEQGIDDWLVCVTNMNEVCVQLEILMDKCMMAYRMAFTDQEEKKNKSRVLLLEI